LWSNKFILIILISKYNLYIKFNFSENTTVAGSPYKIEQSEAEAIVKKVNFISVGVYSNSLHHLFDLCEFKPRSWRGVLDTTLCDNVCQLLVTGQ
jgi:hypothetical protein